MGISFLGYVFLTFAIASGVYIGTHPKIYRKILHVVGLFFKVLWYVLMGLGVWWLITTIWSFFSNNGIVQIQNSYNNFWASSLGHGFLYLFFGGSVLVGIWLMILDIKNEGVKSYWLKNILPRLKMTTNVAGISIILVFDVIIFLIFILRVLPFNIWYLFGSSILIIASFYPVVRLWKKIG